MEPRLTVMKRAWWGLGGMLMLVVGYPAAGIALYDFERPEHETVSEWREDEFIALGNAYWTQVERQEFICYWHRGWVRDYCPASIRNSMTLLEIFWPVQRMVCLLRGDGAVIESRYELSDYPRGGCVVINDVRVVQR